MYTNPLRLMKLNANTLNGENELGRVPKNIKLPEIKGIQKMINRLHKEVFAYFQEGWTNSFTETTNSLIRKIVRDGNGYGFEVLRGKILYSPLKVISQ